MTDERAKQLKAQIKTVRNLANSPETRELCTILISVLNELPKSDKPQQCGFGYGRRTHAPERRWYE